MVLVAMDVLVVGERRDGLSELSMRSETYVANGSGVTGQLPKIRGHRSRPVF